MTVIPFAPVSGRLLGRPATESAGRQAHLIDLVDLAERARLKGNMEHADRLLLAAWAAYESQGQASAMDLSAA